MFQVIKVYDVCEGMQIGWSTEVVSVLSVKKNREFVTLILSNGVCKCYDGHRLLRILV